MNKALVLVLLAFLPGAARAWADPVSTGPSVLDSSGQLARPSALQMSIARDGTGGIVYLRRDPSTGQDRAFLSRLTAGSFRSPVPIDSSLPGASSQAVLAAGNGGLLLIAFINGGTLETVTVPSASAPVPQPVALAGAAADPAISSNLFSEAYLAFTEAPGAASRVRVAEFTGDGWSLVNDPLSDAAGDGAGSGAGRPALATAGDGTAVVAWGEGGHVLSRKVSGMTLSPAVEQADAPGSGCQESSSGDPEVGTEGDSSYADVVFQESEACGGSNAPQARVLERRLRGSAYEALRPVDGISGAAPGPGGGSSAAPGVAEPSVAEGEYGRGLVTAVRTDTGSILATVLGTDGVLQATQQVNSQPLSAVPVAVPALAGLFSTMVVWEQTPGSGVAADVRIRYALNGSNLAPEVVVSSPAAGPTDAADGMAAAGDVQGDAAVAWLQGPPGAPDLYVSQMLQPPGPFTAVNSFAYSRSPQPTLSWTAPTELWGGLTYQVSVDGHALGQTQSTSFTVPAALSDGVHSWQVQATNQVGETSVTPSASVWVDTLAPSVSLMASGTLQVAAPVTVGESVTDLGPGGAVAPASGVASGMLDLGDASSSSTTSGGTHVYARPGRYLITATVEDRAGNAGTGRLVVRITAATHARRRARRHVRAVSRPRSRRPARGRPSRRPPSQNPRRR